MAKLVAGGVTLRSQINERFPKRDKTSDGWIGDKAHQSRKSDHNPDEKGWVHAIDIDENMGKGKGRKGSTAMQLANEILAYAASGLPGSARVKYVIYEDRIASATDKKLLWKWRSSGYGHTAHIHISFTEMAQKDKQPWPLPILALDPEQKETWASALETKKKVKKLQ